MAKSYGCQVLMGDRQRLLTEQALLQQCVNSSLCRRCAAPASATSIASSSAA